jgi:hypothetical protein
LALLVLDLEKHRETLVALGREALAKSDAVEAAALAALGVSDEQARALLEARGPARRDALLAIRLFLKYLRPKGPPPGRDGPASGRNGDGK